MCGVSRTNASDYLTTPTSDATGESVHPSVVDAGAGLTWNGYRYWMAMTPFPGGDAAAEFPEILASADGDTWVVPEGLTNPIAGAVGGLNADPDLVWTPDKSALWCYYFTDVAVSTLKAIKSTNGTTWTDETTLFTGDAQEYLSPSVIYNASLGLYQMWRVDATNRSDTQLYYHTCATPNGAWSEGTLCTQTNKPTGKELWHMEVTLENGQYRMLAAFGNDGSFGQDSILYYGWSSDGLAWTFSTIALLYPGSSSAWDGGLIYRASWLPTATGHDLFYSARGTAIAPQVWHIGRTTVTGL